MSVSRDQITHFMSAHEAIKTPGKIVKKKFSSKFCAFCGAEFTPVRSWQHYDKPLCRYKAFLARRAEAELNAIAPQQDQSMEVK